MNINFNAPILNLDGNEITEGGEAVTLRSVAINALLATLADGAGRPEQLGGTEKVRLATLAQAIHSAEDELDLEVEDVALIKERIGRAYQPLAVMQAWKLLEGKTQ